MKQPKDDGPDRAQSQSRPVTWVSAQLRDQIQRTGAALAETRERPDREPPEPGAMPVAELEAEP